MVNPFPIVLVHGAWHGGWCWAKLRPFLDAAGAQMFTPTLTGLGERHHLREPVPGLATHVADIAEAIEAEELEDVILVGHSYAGMVITGVADRLRNRIRHLVYLDAAVPADGDDFASQVPGMTPEQLESRRDAYRNLSTDGVWLPPPEPDMVGVFEPGDADWLRRRMTPHPLRTWFDPLPLPNGGHRGIAKTYIVVTDPPTTFMGYPAHGEIARRGGEWRCREIACGHNAMVAAPRDLARLILESASG